MKIYFAHGKESGPWGSKIRHLAAIAREAGRAVESPDYSDLGNPDERVERLRGLLATESEVVLAGSSMGGYVSTVVAGRQKVAGLFLMAPALFMPGYQQQEFGKLECPVEVVHGWQDEIIPAEHSVRFAQSQRATLHLIEDDHRLSGQLPRVGEFFRGFLQRLRVP